MPLLLKLFAVKAIGTIIGGVFLFSRGSPGFERITPRAVGETLVVEAVLKNGFNKGLDEIIMSGTEVVLGYGVTLLERGPGGEVVTIRHEEVHQEISYRPALSEYWVIKNSDTLNFSDLVKAKEAVSRLRLEIMPLSAMNSRSQFAFKLDAALNTVEIEALNVKEFDLNAFWNYKYPRKTSDWFSVAQLPGMDRP